MHEDGRVSRTIRVAYSSRVLAYSKQRANASQFALRVHLRQEGCLGQS